MIVIVTSNAVGGIAQFADTLTDSLNAAGVSAVEFIPSGSSSHNSFARRLPSISQTDALARRNPLKQCISVIKACEPEAVLLADTALVTLAIALGLCGCVPVYAVIHDAKPHPSGSRSLKAAILNQACKMLSKKVFSQSQGLVFLSENTRREFESEYGETQKGISLKLCAHPVSCEPMRPNDLPESVVDFVLFFGRIDKYKGLGRLFEVYSEPNSELPSLVVAGSGALSCEEIEALSRCENVVFLNRFISDNEMTWLFSNCVATVLPYIEASQSGVLAMSYHFGKPVVVSDLPGLTEFVDEGSTGCVFRSVSELAGCLRKAAQSDDWSDRIADYAETNLSWKVNVSKLIDGMGIARQSEPKSGHSPVLSEDFSD